MRLKRSVLMALLLSGTVVVLIFVLGVFGNNSSSQSSTSDTSQTTSQSESSSQPPNTQTPAPSSTPPSATQPTSSGSATTPTASSPTTSTPVSSVACGKSNGPCTTSQIATHNSASDCWIIYNGYYYNITPYALQHPGGAAVFNSTTCGHDISAYLSGAKSAAGQRHRHSLDAYDTLPFYRVGPVQ